MAIGRIPEPGTGIQESIVDAKGDLISATAADTPARLGVGADGTTLVADSGEATGLRWNNPAWVTFTPAFTNLTVGNATLTAKYLNINKTVFFNVQVVFGSTSSMGAAANLTLPVAAASTAASQGGIYQITFQDHGVGTFVGAIQALNNTTTTVRFGGIETGSSYATYVATSSIAPLGWGTNDQIYISGMYEVA